MRLILLFLIAALIISTEAGFGVYFHSHIKAQLYCRGHPLEAWVYVMKAKYPSHDLLYYYTHLGYLDIIVNSVHWGWIWDENCPGFLLRIKADCGCGGDEFFELPLVSEDRQYRAQSNAEKWPYDYGRIDISDCSKRKDPNE